MRASRKIALVTGGNKGVGLSMCRQLVKNNCKVFLGSRDIVRGQNAIDTNFEPTDEVSVVQLDVCNQESIEKAAESIQNETNGIDVLINNAGAVNEQGQFDIDSTHEVFATNYYGAINVTKRFIPLLNERTEHDLSRIITVGSANMVWALKAMLENEVGHQHWNDLMNDQLTESSLNDVIKQFLSAAQTDPDNIEQRYGWKKAAYPNSKMAIAVYNRILAHQLRDKVFVATFHPGLCPTDLNKHRGKRTVQQGAYCGSQLATLDITSEMDNFPSGRMWDATLSRKAGDAWRETASLHQRNWMNWFKLSSYPLQQNILNL